MKVCPMLLFASFAAAVLAGPARALTQADLCPAAQGMQLFYYYLQPGADASVKARKPVCPGWERDFGVPGWLESALPAMAARKVWKDPEEELSEAQLWQAPVSVLYEFADTTKKTVQGGPADPPVSPFALENEYNDMRVRLMLGIERLARARLESSFEGRGTGLFSDLGRIMERMDALTNALAARDRDGFYAGAGEAAALSKGLFERLYAEPDRGPRFRYRPEPRILPGYRGVSLEVPGWQTLFLSAGERVDLLVTFDAVTGKGNETITATILQNVVALKVARPGKEGGTGVLQLLCNPNEAQYAVLSLAQCKSLNVVRRAAGDVELHPMEIASFGKLLK